jgi:hypothetical protein
LLAAAAGGDAARDGDSREPGDVSERATHAEDSLLSSCRVGFIFIYAHGPDL